MFSHFCDPVLVPRHQLILKIKRIWFGVVFTGVHAQDKTMVIALLSQHLFIPAANGDAHQKIVQRVSESTIEQELHKSL